MIAFHPCFSAVEYGCKGARRWTGCPRGSSRHKADKARAWRSVRRAARQGIHSLGEDYEIDYGPRLTSWDVS